MLIFPKGVADKIEKIKVKDFDVNLFSCNVVHKAVQNVIWKVSTNLFKTMK